MRHDGAVLRLDLVTVVVHDYDDAIAYYVDVLGFEVTEDVAIAGAEPGRRWVVVRPPAAGDGSTPTGLLLARAKNDAQLARVGDQTGGRVGFFLGTDDFDAQHRRLVDAGVRFLESPRMEAYGRVAVFEDLYGNRWDFLELPAG